AYTPAGTLVSRRVTGAVLHDPDEIARRCVAMATRQPITDVEGGRLQLSPDSICVHGDTPGAVDIARAVKSALAAAGIVLAPFS
ncbi:MAG: LamB/YcsF family protein, partial [Frankiales bacterium]|nr:LamB/YcsF family protein [Frankiales bacterium]